MSGWMGSIPTSTRPSGRTATQYESEADVGTVILQYGVTNGYTRANGVVAERVVRIHLKDATRCTNSV
jgi:hypothetical protein